MSPPWAAQRLNKCARWVIWHLRVDMRLHVCTTRAPRLHTRLLTILRAACVVYGPTQRTLAALTRRLPVPSLAQVRAHAVAHGEERRRAVATQAAHEAEQCRPPQQVRGVTRTRPSLCRAGRRLLDAGAVDSWSGSVGVGAAPLT